MHQNIKELRDRIQADLAAAFPCKVSLTRAEFAQAIGFSVGTIANLESQKRPLVEPIRLGDSPRYPLSRIADFLFEAEAKLNKPRRGRPSKASKFEAEGGAA